MCDTQSGLLLGKGTFGSVFMRKVDGSNRAVKVFHKGRCEKAYKKELTMLQLVRSSMKKKPIANIIKMVSYNDTTMEIVFPLMKRSLADIIRKEKLQLNIIIKIAKEIFSGLSFLHENRIIHLDIKPANLLIGHNDCIHIADFGLAQQCDEVKHTFKVVTPLYRPLEVHYRDINFSCPVDIWSTACVVGEMVLGKPLFEVSPQSSKQDSSDGAFVQSIYNRLGVPTDQEWPGVQSLPWYRKFEIARPIEPVGLPVLGCRELESLQKRALSLNPSQRPTAESMFKSFDETFFTPSSNLEPMAGNKRQHEASTNSSESINESAKMSATNALTGVEYLREYFLQLVREDAEEEERCKTDSFACNLSFPNGFPTTLGVPHVKATVHLKMQMQDCVQYRKGLFIEVDMSLMGKESAVYDGVIQNIDYNMATNQKTIIATLTVDAQCEGQEEEVPKSSDTISCRLSRKYSKTACVRQKDTILLVKDAITKRSTMHTALEMLLGIHTPSPPHTHTSVQQGNIAADGANKEQCKAITCSQRNPVTIVHGPVGTGKSFVAVRCIANWVNNGKRVLVSASTNNASGDLARTLHERGISVTWVQARTEEMKHANDPSCDYTLQGKINSRVDPAVADLDGNVWSQLKYWQTCPEDLVNPARMKHSLLEAEDFIIRESSVVCCTLTCAGDHRLKRLSKNKYYFDALCVEEAGQARVVEVMNAILLCTIDSQVLFIGDPNQLTPYLSNKAYDLLGESCFARLVNNNRMDTITLTEQGRMRGLLADIVSELCYRKQLNSAPYVNARPLPGGLADAGYDSNLSAAWVAVPREPPQKCATSWYHDGEITTACQLARYYVDRGVALNDMYFITSFAANKIRLISALETVFNTQSFTDRVGTIDGSQGKECAIVFFLPVKPTIFLTKPRFTVAISRARDQLVVISDPYEHRKQSIHDPMRMLLEYLNRRNCLFAGDDTPYGSVHLQRKSTNEHRFVPNLCRRQILTEIREGNSLFTQSYCVQRANAFAAAKELQSTSSAVTVSIGPLSEHERAVEHESSKVSAPLVTNTKNSVDDCEAPMFDNMTHASGPSTGGVVNELEEGEIFEDDMGKREDESRNFLSVDTEDDENAIHAMALEEEPQENTAMVLNTDAFTATMRPQDRSSAVTESKEPTSEHDSGVEENQESGFYEPEEGEIVEDDMGKWEDEAENFLSIDTEDDEAAIHAMALEQDEAFKRPIDEYVDFLPLTSVRKNSGHPGIVSLTQVAVSEMNEEISAELVQRIALAEEENNEPKKTDSAVGDKQNIAASSSKPTKRAIKQINEWWTSKCNGVECSFVHLSQGMQFRSALELYVENYLHMTNPVFTDALGDVAKKVILSYSSEDKKFPF